MGAKTKTLTGTAHLFNEHWINVFVDNTGAGSKVGMPLAFLPEHLQEQLSRLRLPVAIRIEISEDDENSNTQ